MRKPAEIFWGVNPRDWMSGSEKALQSFLTAAKNWEDEGNHFAAGYSYSRMISTAFGKNISLEKYFNLAYKNYHACLADPSSNVFSKIASLHKLVQLLGEMSWRYRLNLDLNKKLEREKEKCLIELSSLISSEFSQDKNIGKYLVHGFQLKTDLDSKWSSIFTGWEVNWGTEQWGGKTVTFSIPSVFKILVFNADYDSANKICDDFPENFISPGLKGWKKAVKGFVDFALSHEHFGEAAEEFAKDDKPPKNMKSHGGFWSSKNKDLWSTYFASRAELSKARINPKNAKKHILKASEIVGSEAANWLDTGVSRYRILMQTLASLISDKEVDTADAENLFLREVKMRGETDQDTLLLEFITSSGEAFDDLKNDPGKALAEGKLAKALAVLEKLPILNPEIIELVKPHVGDKVFEKAIHGPLKTWVHRTLESITDERLLHKIIKRLAQASIPLHAQIIHGPIEYGNDVIVLLKNENKLELRSYQVKSGDIKKKDWYEIKSQLEEIFLIDPPTNFQLSKEDRYKQIGILIHNGHTHNITQPLMESWIADQKKTHGRNYSYMNLDSFVNWIVDDKLISEFKKVLEELSIQIL